MLVHEFYKETSQDTNVTYSPFSQMSHLDSLCNMIYIYHKISISTPEEF